MIRKDNIGPIQKFLCILSVLLSTIWNDVARSTDQWNADEYKDNALLQAGWAKKFFFKEYEFSGNEKVLDICSGVGKLTAEIARRAPCGEVIGIDKSDSMVKSASATYKELTNLRFDFNDVENAYYYTQYLDYFDLVVSFSSLHWIQAQKVVLEGVLKVLKKGGKFYFKLSSKGGDPIQEISDSLKDHPSFAQYFKGFIDPMNRFSPDEYRTLLTSAGLSVQSIHDQEERDVLDSKDSLSKQIKSWLPHYHFLRRQNDKVAEMYLEHVINCYLGQYPPLQDGSIILIDHYLEVIGYKRAESASGV